MADHPNKHIHDTIRYAKSKGWMVTKAGPRAHIWGMLMKVHEFTLILTADPNEKEADRLYGICNDGTLSTIAGIPQIHFHREAPALEEALRSAIAHVKAAGFEVERVEIEPEAVTSHR